MPENEEIIEVLSCHANGYIRSLACSHPLRKQMLCTMFDFLGLKGKGLDLGCGIGLPAMEAFGKGVEVVGLDRETEFIEIARRIARTLSSSTGLPPPPEFVQGDVTCLEFENNLFDWALSLDCINYAKDLVGEPLAEMKRVVKPGGRIILAAWSSQALLPGYPVLEARLNATPRGIAPFESGMSPQRHFMFTTGALKDLGLKNIRCKTFLQDLSHPLNPRILRAVADLFCMRWGKSLPGLSAGDQALYKALTDPESDRFILASPAYYGFFTYTMFTGVVL